MSVYGIYQGEILTAIPERLYFIDNYKVTFDTFADEETAKRFMRSDTLGILKGHISGVGDRIIHITTDDNLFTYNDHQDEWGLLIGCILVEFEEDESLM